MTSMTTTSANQGVRAVHFLSRHAAQELYPALGNVIISIHDNSEPPAQLMPGWEDRLTLNFHDTDDADGVQTPFSREQAQQVLAFVQKHRDSAARIYVHCSMGVSRSAGIAFAVAGMLKVPCIRGGQTLTHKQWNRMNRRCYEMLQMEALRAGWNI